MNQLSVATSGFRGCASLQLAIATSGYRCGLVIIDLPCRRVYTDIVELVNSSLIGEVIYTHDLIPQLDSTAVEQLLDSYNIGKDINRTDIASVVVTGESYIIQLTDSSLLTNPVNITKLEELINQVLLTPGLNSTDLVELVNETYSGCIGVTIITYRADTTVLTADNTTFTADYYK